MAWRKSVSAVGWPGPPMPYALQIFDYSMVSSGATRTARVMLWKLGDVAKTISWILRNCSSEPSAEITTRLCSSR